MNAHRADNPTVVVFARRPRAGRVKRRLARTLGGARAALVYRHCLARTLAVVERAGVTRRVLQVADAPDAVYFRRRLRRRGWRIEAQARGDLGTRMCRAFERHCRRGPVILVGSDLADIEPGDLRAAARWLCVDDGAVVGPAADGGFWLLGLRRPVAGMFDGICWSTADVCARLCRNFERSGSTLVMLPHRHDIDRARDLFCRPG